MIESADSLDRSLDLCPIRPLAFTFAIGAIGGLRSFTAPQLSVRPRLRYRRLELDLCPQADHREFRNDRCEQAAHC